MKNHFVPAIIGIMAFLFLAACGPSQHGPKFTPTDFESANFSITSYPGYYPHDFEAITAITMDKKLLYSNSIQCGSYRGSGESHLIEQEIALSDEEYAEIMDLYNATGCENVDFSGSQSEPCNVLDCGSFTIACGENNISLYGCCLDANDFKSNVSELETRIYEILGSHMEIPNIMDLCSSE